MKIFLVLLFLCPLSLCAQSISRADLAATAKHRDALVLQLGTEYDAALKSQKETAAELEEAKTALGKSDAALSANVNANTDLQWQIKTQDSEISSLKWSRWKYLLYGSFLGIVGGLFGLLAVKAGWAGAQAATKLAIYAAKT